jgi:hypothetical protein
MELELKATLNLREYPFRESGILFPLSQTRLKLLIVLQSTKDGEYVIFKENDAFGGSVVFIGSNAKN